MARSGCGRGGSGQLGGVNTPPLPQRAGPVSPGSSLTRALGISGVCTWRGRGVCGLRPRWGAGALRSPNSDAQAERPSGQESELVSLEAPLWCLGPVWAWDGDSGTPGSVLGPQKSLPRAPPLRRETRAQGGERAPAGPSPGGPQGGVQEGVTASEPVVLVRKVRGCKPRRRNPHLRERPGVQSPGSSLGCQDSAAVLSL